MPTAASSDQEWVDLWEHFHRLLELPEPARLQAMDELRSHDPKMAARLALLIEADEQTSGDVFDAIDNPPSDGASDAQPIEQVGPWKLGELLGAGGMGRVYRARRTSGEFDQEAALKLLRVAAFSGRQLAAFRQRFEQERQLLADLDHPNIARLLDGGTSGSGAPYLVMELVDGLPIDAHCLKQGLDVRQRIELCVEVCNAVQAAHERLIVHRDLKPANILVSNHRTTETGGVKLVDFGIAKLLDDSTESTATIHQLLTPRYASPEQIEGSPLTTATDVFSLGTVLYELLTGQHPTASETDSALTVARAIVERDARPPSAAARSSTNAPSGAHRLLRGDLDAVLLRALARRPQDRYGSAIALADDLRAWLEGRPVSARPDSVVYRLRKLAVRNPAVTTLAAAVLLALLGWGLTQRQQAQELRMALQVADQERQRAQLESEIASATRDFLTSVFATTDPNRAGGQLTAREIIERGAARIEIELADYPRVRAAVQFSIGTVYRNLGLLEEGGALLEQALATRRELLPSPHPATAETLDHLGMLRLYQNRHEEALSLLQEALALRRELFTAADPELAISAYSLGSALSQVGRLDEARPLLQEALQLQQALTEPVPDQIGIGATHEQLAVIAHRQGDYQAAIPHYRAAIEATDAHQADNRHSTAHANLGALLLDQGELIEARSVLNQALAVRTKNLGDNHYRVASVLNNLALLEQREGDFEQARLLFERALDINKKSFEAPHSAIATNLNNLGLVNLELRQYQRAAPLFEQAATMQRALFGEEHPNSAYPLSNLGRLRLEQGDIQRAEELLRSALELRLAALPEDHTALATSKAWLGLLLAERGETEEARPLLESAVTIRSAKLAADDWRRAEAEGFLAICLLKEGRASQAHQALVPALGAVREAHGDQSVRTQRLAQAVAEAQRKIQEAGNVE